MESRNLNQVIICPNCGREIPLTEAVLSPFRQKWEEDFKAQYEQKLKEEVTSKVEESFLIKFKERESKLNETEAQLRKENRKLQEKQEAFDLEVQRKADQELVGVKEKYHLEIQQKDEQIKSMQRQIEVLNTKIEQVSPAIKGDAGQQELEDALKSFFPDDEIREIQRGKRGADIMQKVNNKGQFCGTILWESKNTKKWNDHWVEKLKDDQRRIKAEIAVLVTMALPKNIEHFDMIDHIWITRLLLAPHLASVLRMNLIELAMKSIATADKGNKIERLYDYLSSPQFKQRVETVAEPLISMLKDLNEERNAMERIWSKREQEIRTAAKGIAGMHGDMQGIMGTSALPQIELLQLPAQEE